MLQSSRLLIAALWVGALWAIGFVVAPTLFATLGDRSLAGSIAGHLFRVMAWLSIACGVLLLVLQSLVERKSPYTSTNTTRYLIVGMMVCTVMGYFCLQPFMADLREVLSSAQDAAQIADAKRQFGMLHGASTVVYVLQSLLGAVLLLRLR